MLIKTRPSSSKQGYLVTGFIVQLALRIVDDILNGGVGCADTPIYSTKHFQLTDDNKLVEIGLDWNFMKDS